VLYWQLLFVCAVWLFVVAYCCVRRHRMLFLLTSLLVMCVAGSALAWYYHIYRHGIISLVRSTPVYAGPSLKYHEVGCADQYALCCIKAIQGRWVCIEYDGGKGWFPLEQRV
jgi:hypothetical protein